MSVSFIFYCTLDYDIHGHVGFAWGIKRKILDEMIAQGCAPLYDRALIGGADHIMAHACTTPSTCAHSTGTDAGAGTKYLKYLYKKKDNISGGVSGCGNGCGTGSSCPSLPQTTGVHYCVSKSHVDPNEIQYIQKWSAKFYALCQGKLGYISGSVYHRWHGNLTDRNYHNRILEISPCIQFIKKKDKNGLYYTDDAAVIELLRSYFNKREVKPINATTTTTADNIITTTADNTAPSTAVVKDANFSMHQQQPVICA